MPRLAGALYDTSDGALSGERGTGLRLHGRPEDGRHGHSRTVEPHRPPQVDDGLCHGGGCVTWVAAGAPGARLPPGRIVCLLAIAPLVAPACRAAQLPAALLA